MAAPTEDGVALRDIWLLRLEAPLARAHGDAAAYAHLRDRYRGMARTLGLKGISRGPRRCHNRVSPEACPACLETDEI
jgi:hypothetical protein